MKKWALNLLFAVGLAAGLAAPGLAVEAYAHTNSKGNTYYLFHKEVPLKNSDRVQTIYYFSKDPNNVKGEPLAEVPADRIVSETKNGLPVLKKRKAN
ncbi:MAG: hypothetical protein OEP95_04775 [Myxococcales bacterium]|nr:hypothetical protein [Myxococcales bacterium]